MSTRKSITEADERFEAEERAYWSQRDELMKTHRGKWVAIVDGKVVAEGDDSNRVMDSAYQSTRSRAMFVALVGDENVEYVIRATAVGRYDDRYSRPIPTVAAGVRNPDVEDALQVDFIVDTGADITVFEESVCGRLNLRAYPAQRASVRGLGGEASVRRLVHTSNWLNGGFRSRPTVGRTSRRISWAGMLSTSSGSRYALNIMRSCSKR